MLGNVLAVISINSNHKLGSIIKIPFPSSLVASGDYIPTENGLKCSHEFNEILQIPPRPPPLFIRPAVAPTTPNYAAQG